MFTFTHRNPEMQIDKPAYSVGLGRHAERVSPEEKTGTYYELIADALKKRNVIENLEQLLQTAQEARLLHHPFAALVLSDRPAMERTSRRDRRLSRRYRVLRPQGSSRSRRLPRFPG